eukprot:TRINITY_DN28174_c0_g2_i6.p2 TRINITY_DN28174_c0_g2~~TRINITY_DN28174_c0_g2_i6.p2  ORF type:complete len:370 (-),score=54.67 TRINITY_DN28174_c0_g2_i6:1087-2196(-)
MAPSAVSSLFTPLKVGKCELQHRIAMSAMTRTRNDPETEAPREMNALYYGQRASPGGLIISEGTHPTAEGYGYIRAPGLYSQDMVDGWRKVTESVHQKGGYIFCQIMHCGRVSHPSLLPNGMTPVAPSAVKPEGLVHIRGGKAEYETPRALETSEVERIVQDHVEAAKKAIEGGFDGIELHGGNGYLIQEFLALKTNQREDKYGGSVENRCRFLLEIVDGCIEAIGADRVGIKYQGGVSFSDLIEPEEDVQEQLKYLGPELSKRNLAYVCVSSLNYEPYFRFVKLSEPKFHTNNSTSTSTPLSVWQRVLSQALLYHNISFHKLIQQSEYLGIFVANLKNDVNYGNFNVIFGIWSNITSTCAPAQNIFGQ